MQKIVLLIIVACMTIKTMDHQEVASEGSITRRIHIPGMNSSFQQIFPIICNTTVKLAARSKLRNNSLVLYRHLAGDFSAKIKNKFFLQVANGAGIVRFCHNVGKIFMVYKPLGPIFEDDSLFVSSYSPNFQTNLFETLEVENNENGTILVDSIQPVIIRGSVAETGVRRYGIHCVNKGLLQLQKLYLLMTAEDYDSYTPNLRGERVYNGACEVIPR